MATKKISERSENYRNQYHDFETICRNENSDRTNEIIKDLSYYWSIGKVWQELIKFYFSSEHLYVAEIGSGAISKVGIGLIYNNFAGHLTLIEIDTLAAKRAKNCLKFFGSKFLCSLHKGSIFSNYTKRFDAIFANNFLQDLLVHKYDQECLKDSLIKLIDDISIEMKFINHIISDFAAIIYEKLSRGGVIVLLDYMHSHKKDFKNQKIETLVRLSQTKLRAELKKLGALELSFNKRTLIYGQIKIYAKELIVFTRPENNKFY